MWESVREWLMLGVTLAAVIVAVVSVAHGRADARRAEKDVWESNDMTRASNTKISQLQAAAATSAREAKRSADAAESAEQRQRAAESRATEVNDVDWKFDRSRKSEASSYVLINNGPHAALDVLITLSSSNLSPEHVYLGNIPDGERRQIETSEPVKWLVSTPEVKVRWKSPLGVPKEEKNLKLPGYIYGV